MIEIELFDASSWEEVGAQVRAHGGAALLDRGLALEDPPLGDHDVRFLKMGSGEILWEGRGRLVQVTPTGLAVVFANPDALLATPWESEAEAEAETPLWQRYPELSKAERIALARRGNADARRAVLRDRDQSLHVYLLSNPGLTSGELASMLRSGAPNPLFLSQVAKRADLMRDASVVEALVRNPKTPIQIAVQAVAKLPLEVAARISKQARLRKQIVTAARRRVVK